jgi:hypothetical protein
MTACLLGDLLALCEGVVVGALAARVALETRFHCRLLAILKRLQGSTTAGDGIPTNSSGSLFSS